jgi:hypothetical protein
MRTASSYVEPRLFDPHDPVASRLARSSRPLRDAEIRQALREQLTARHAHDLNCAVLDELEICHGEARVDLAVANGRLDGFEIKSDYDSLARLGRQVDIYGRVFDRMTIVSGQRHITEVFDRVPSWWAVALALPRGDVVALRTIRRGRANPDRRPDQIATLLDRKHALDLLAVRRLDKGVRSKSIDVLRDMCACEVPLSQLRAAARDAVRARAALRLGPSPP